jgi:hypothetical protein
MHPYDWPGTPETCKVPQMVFSRDDRLHLQMLQIFHQEMSAIGL